MTVNVLKEAVLILAPVWFGFLIAGEIQKIYYAWQHQKVQKIYNETLRMLSERIRSRIKQDELNDVLIVAYVLGLVGGYSVRNWDKLERWAKRIQEGRKEFKDHEIQGL